MALLKVMRSRRILNLCGVGAEREENRCENWEKEPLPPLGAPTLSPSPTQRLGSTILRRSLPFTLRNGWAECLFRLRGRHSPTPAKAPALWRALGAALGSA